MEAEEVALKLEAVERTIDTLIDAVLNGQAQPDISWASAMDALFRKASRLRDLLESTS